MLFYVVGGGNLKYLIPYPSKKPFAEFPSRSHKAKDVSMINPQQQFANRRQSFWVSFVVISTAVVREKNHPNNLSVNIISIFRGADELNQTTTVCREQGIKDGGLEVVGVVFVS